jgi:hypothetical protein
MSHSITPTKTKFARPKSRANRPAKPATILSGSTRGGTKQEAVLALLRQPKVIGLAAEYRAATVLIEDAGPGMNLFWCADITVKRRAAFVLHLAFAPRPRCHGRA